MQAREWRQMSARHAHEARLWEALASSSGDCGWAHSYYTHQAHTQRAHAEAALAQADAWSTTTAFEPFEKGKHETKCPYKGTQATAKMV